MRYSKDFLQNKVVLVTGGSSGIGEAIARLLSLNGLRVVMLARRATEMATIQSEIQARGGNIAFVSADLSSTSNIASVYQSATTLFGDFDIIVNNAGLAWYGYFKDMTADTIQTMINVHAAATVRLSSLALPTMLSKGYGHIVNMSSVAGDIPSQGVAVYSACKSFMTSFTTVLVREMKGTGVHASAIMPGPVLTDLSLRSSDAGGRHFPTRWIGVTPQYVAKKVYDTLRFPRRKVSIPGFLAVTPWIESLFGWAMDAIGPLLLKRT
jgi:hypothetical protein